MSQIYMSKLEHFSCLADSVKKLREKSIDLSNYNFAEEDEIIDLKDPLDLKDVLGAKGLQYKDAMSKTSSYIAKKLVEDVDIPSFDEVGVIYVTEYGNLKSMLNLSNLGKSSTKPISAQIFPNATMSSAAVTTAIYLKARGLNMTINSGVLSTIYALKIAKDYLSAGKINSCIILACDDYHPYSIEDLTKAGKKSDRYLSAVSGVLLTKDKVPCEDNKFYTLEDVFVEDKYEVVIQKLKEKSLSEGRCINHLAGYNINNEVSNVEENSKIQQISWLKNNKTYVGPGITFFQLVDCLNNLQCNERLDMANVITFDTLVSVGYFSVGRV